MKSNRMVAALLALALAAAVSGCRGKSRNEMGGGPPAAPVPGEAPGGEQPPLHAPQPGATGCPTVSGEYRLAFKTTCGSNGWGWVDVEQSGCDITANMKQLAVVKGRLQGDAANVSLAFNFPCGGSGSGLLTVSGRIISGSFSGVQTGTEIRCCTPVSGTFTMTKQ